MAANTYSDLYSRMVTELTGCSIPLILQTLQDIGRDFCSRTEAWIEDLPSIDLVADEDEYTVQSSWNARIDRIREVRINTTEGVTAGNEGTLQEPDDYEFDGDHTLKLDDSIVPTSAVTDGLDVQVAIVPNWDAQELDPAFLERWAEAIIFGAKAALMIMPNKQWTNPQLAVFYSRKYEDQISSAVGEKHKRYKHGDMVVEFPGFL